MSQNNPLTAILDAQPFILLDGAKVIQMDFADKFRVVDQHFRRPQAVGEIAAARFQLRRHRAVQQDKGPGVQDGG